MDDLKAYLEAERNAVELFKRYWPTDTARNADFRLFMFAMTGREYGNNLHWYIKKFGMTPTGKLVKRSGKVYRTFKVR